MAQKTTHKTEAGAIAHLLSRSFLAKKPKCPLRDGANYVNEFGTSIAYVSNICGKWVILET